MAVSPPASVVTARGAYGVPRSTKAGTVVPATGLTGENQCSGGGSLTLVQNVEPTNGDNRGESGHWGCREENIIEVVGQLVNVSRLCLRQPENHRRFAEHSEQPWLTEYVRLLAADAESRLSDPTGESVHHD